MAELIDGIDVSGFIEAVREMMTPDDQQDDVEVIARRLIRQCPQSVNTLGVRELPVPLYRDEVDRKLVDVLLSHCDIKMIFIISGRSAESLPMFLDVALPKMQNVTEIFWELSRMSAAEATRVFSVIQKGIPSGQLCLHLRLRNDSEEGTYPVSAFCDFIRASTQLKRFYLGDEIEDGEGLSEEMFDSLCQAVGECPSPLFSVLALDYVVLKRQAPERAAKSLANAIFKNKHLSHLQLFRVNVSDGFFRQSLLRTPAVKNFDLSFQAGPSITGNSLILDIFRSDSPHPDASIPWKQVLPLDLPLNVWPLVLEEANKWNQTSHSSLDAVFLLLKEKSNVLLQNIHRRRIRKRKRFQFESL